MGEEDMLIWPREKNRGDGNLRNLVEERGKEEEKKKGVVRKPKRAFAYYIFAYTATQMYLTSDMKKEQKEIEIHIPKTETVGTKAYN